MYLHREAIRQRGPIASRGGSVQLFLKKPLATSVFPGWGVKTPCPTLYLSLCP